MTMLTIEYEGRTLRRPATSRATHVIVSRTHSGDLRVQPTDDPVHAMIVAQDNGDDERRMAAIEGRRAVFTVVPDSDVSGQQVREAGRRAIALDLLALALLLLLLGALAYLVV